MKHEEYQYLELLQNILNTGIIKSDRTGVGTKSIFGATMRFDIRENFIFLTTKKLFLRGVFEELKLFLSGDTNTKILEDNGITIWKGNTSREFLNKRGLTALPEGDLGCGYPHCWRNFGGEHPHLAETKGLRGVDQIASIINSIKNEPNSRRIYLTGSNPAQEHLAALPACHNYAQFYVNTAEKKLNCFVLMRSNDLFLGNPWNLAQYNLLTIYLARLTNLHPGELLYQGIDVHLYLNHLEQARTQLQREPRPFPQLKISKKLETLDDVLSLKFTDLELVGYNPHPSIPATMAI